MKFNPLQLIQAMSKFMFYGIVIQCFFWGMLLAASGNAQERKSVKEVYIDLNLKNVDLFEALNAI